MTAAAAVRTVSNRYGDNSSYQFYHDYRLGDVLALTGVDNVSLTFALDDFVTQVQLSGVAGSNANTFQLPAGYHRQQLLVTCAAKAGGSVVLVPVGGVTAKQTDNTTALASLTFSAAAQYALLNYSFNRWVVAHTSATQA